MSDLFTDLLTIAENMSKQAEATGDVQTMKWGDGVRRDIVKNGQVVGSYRIAAMEITVTPTAKPKRKRKAKAARTRKPSDQS